MTPVQGASVHREGEWMAPIMLVETTDRQTVETTGRTVEAGKQRERGRGREEEVEREM